MDYVTGIKIGKKIRNASTEDMRAAQRALRMVGKKKINIDLPPGLPPLMPAVRLKQN